MSPETEESVVIRSGHPDPDRADADPNGERADPNGERADHPKPVLAYVVLPYRPEGEQQADHEPDPNTTAAAASGAPS